MKCLIYVYLCIYKYVYIYIYIYVYIFIHIYIYIYIYIIYTYLLCSHKFISDPRHTDAQMSQKQDRLNIYTLVHRYQQCATVYNFPKCIHLYTNV